MNKNVAIDFLCIGAQKAGTSWLHYNLSRLPEFSLPPIKEFHYFDRDHKYPTENKLAETRLAKRIKQRWFWSFLKRKVMNAVKEKDWKSVRFYLKWSFSNYSDEWYVSLFESYTGYTGELSPGYSILDKEDILQMFRLLPKVKLIFLVRNPIERTWSGFKHVNKKNFDSQKINSDDIIKFIESNGPSMRSNYIRIIDNFLSIYPKEQFLLCFYDAILDNPKGLMNDILNHICENKNISFSHLDLDKIIHKSPTADCPQEIKEYLKIKYHDQIKELSEKYGGYFTRWYDETYLESSNKILKPFPPAMYLP